MSDWAKYYAFDVMADLTFGSSFRMLQTGEMHSLIPMLESGQKALGFIGAVPWLFTIVTKLPLVSSQIATFCNWCELKIRSRKQVTPFSTG